MFAICVADTVALYGDGASSACAADGASASATNGASISADARERIHNPPVGMNPPRALMSRSPLTTHALPGATHEPWRSLNVGLGGAAAFAAAVQRHVVI